MSYPLRVYMENYWYHVYSRGQRGQPLFFSPQDRIEYMKRLDRKLERGGANIASFCLMVNHMHLLLRMGKTSLGDILRNVNSKYARNFNQRRGTIGHVVQSRPGVKIVLSDNYLKSLIGYIHRNPLEAGVVKKIRDYKWSSWYWFVGVKCPWIKLKSWRGSPGFEAKSTMPDFNGLCGQKSNSYPEGKGFIGTQEQWSNIKKRKKVKNTQVPGKKDGRRTMEQIAGEIARSGSCNIEPLRGRSRKRSVSALRHKAMNLMWNEGYNQTKIANFFNCTPGAVHKVVVKAGPE